MIPWLFVLALVLPSRSEELDYHARVPFQLDDQQVRRLFVLNTPSGSVILCFLSDALSFEDCCAPSLGPSGNEDCWDEAFTHELCCSEAQRQLAETTQWPAEHVFHNAYVTAQKRRESWWLYFPHRVMSFCPDMAGPDPHAAFEAALSSIVKGLDMAGAAESIRAFMARAEPSSYLWGLVREACLLFVAFTFAVWLAATQAEVGLISPEAATEVPHKAGLHFIEAMGVVTARIGASEALQDAWGVPLLEPSETATVWAERVARAWGDVRKGPSSLQALAKMMFWRARAAFEATEDLYYHRLRKVLLRHCGGVCDDNLQSETRAAFWVPAYIAEVDCPGLLGNQQLFQPAALRPAPRYVPWVFGRDFARGGVALLGRYELVPSEHKDLGAESQRCRMWQRESIEELRGLLHEAGQGPLRWERFSEHVGYDTESLNATARFLRDIDGAVPLLTAALGGHWLVLGSYSPWIEAALLERGVASRVTTLDHSDFSGCRMDHPLVRVVSPIEFAGMFESFDGFVQYSSVEHSGLGKYGDEINPWADRQIIAQLWCRGRPGAWFLFGPGPEGPGGSMFGRELHSSDRAGMRSTSTLEDKIYFNAGRDYGRTSFGRLMLNWELVRPASSTWNVHLFRRVGLEGRVIVPD